ncbi:alpha/beta fold hydrolase [Wenzhouxiangella sp. AB-CW3]|uniref:alpha/beta hydrolase n=1 Tax=Wenzhouxiangella sp. AB-CW3 TaxID=2771012 RepID=UPI00168B9980|nr:alpha/beta hydrolase [Wenzhouxiangella sp. AB-CW3]QOC21959.1 alpha/beta fold hydrolase [Wenzhouxiangella sp. AB-CW3]
MIGGWMLVIGLAVAGGPANSPALEPCHVTDLPARALCGSYAVSSNSADDARVELAFTVVPARPDRRSEDAVLILAGGPGQAARDLAGPTGRLLAKTGKRRDLVFVDQRGTGESMPLDCPDFPTETSVQAQKAWAGRCLDTIDFAAADFRPRDFSTLRFIKDLESVRLALGYEQWNLFAGSYGTRVGQLYMREHAGAIRSAVLDGLAPMGMVVGASMGADAQPVLGALFQRCQAQAGCRTAFPNLESRFRSLIEELERSPVKVTFDHPDTGKAMERELDRDGLVTVLRGLLYQPSMQRLLPLMLHQATEGDFRSLMALTEQFEVRYDEQMSFGLTATVLCSEDIGRFGREAVPMTEHESFVGSAQVDFWMAVCEQWPRYQVPDDFDNPVTGDIPSLLISGELDPVTPPRYGEDVMAGLDNARHLVIPGGGHTVAFAGGRCMRTLLNEFFNDPRPKALDAECKKRQQAAPLLTHRTGYLSGNKSKNHD